MTDEVALHVFPHVTLIEGDADRGEGELRLTNLRVQWRQGERVHEWGWRDVVMHALASDASVHARPCIYCHLDASAEDDALRELRFVPANVQDLGAIFEAFNEGAALNPDPVNEMEGEGDWVFNDDEVYGAMGANPGLHGARDDANAFEDGDEGDEEDEGDYMDES